MHNQLSILIPTYNDPCTSLVGALVEQLHGIPSLKWEIIVADDGSTDKDVLHENRQISAIDGCQIIERSTNTGRAAIRNFLGKQAQYDTLLFVDADMMVEKDNFISEYLRQKAQVVYGGYAMKGTSSSLRYRYEKASEQHHSAKNRKLNPYKDFHTSNFLVRRSVFLSHPLDERFRSYGYEDVFYGKTLQRAGIMIEHIDNPTSFCVFEQDEDFINKTDEALCNLLKHKDELKGFSRLLDAKAWMQRWHLSAIVRMLAKNTQPAIRRRLCNGGAPLWLFQIYKLLKIA